MFLQILGCKIIRGLIIMNSREGLWILRNKSLWNSIEIEISQLNFSRNRKCIRRIYFTFDFCKSHKQCKCKIHVIFTEYNNLLALKIEYNIWSNRCDSDLALKWTQFNFITSSEESNIFNEYGVQTSSRLQKKTVHLHPW